MAAVRTRANGTVVLMLEDGERSMLAAILSDVAVMLDDQAEDGVDLDRMLGMAEVDRPVDEAMLRLLPDLAADDPERSAEFRRLTEYDLRQAKLHNARIVLHDLGRGPEIEISATALASWLKSLNDMRLVIATRLGIDSEETAEAIYRHEAELSEADSLFLTVYDFISWVQENLTHAALEGLAESGMDEGEKA